VVKGGCDQEKSVVRRGVWLSKGCGQERSVVKLGVWSSEGCGQVVLPPPT